MDYIGPIFLMGFAIVVPLLFFYLVYKGATEQSKGKRIYTLVEGTNGIKRITNEEGLELFIVPTGELYLTLEAAKEACPDDNKREYPPRPRKRVQKLVKQG